MEFNAGRFTLYLGQSWTEWFDRREIFRRFYVISLAFENETECGTLHASACLLGFGAAVEIYYGE